MTLWGEKDRGWWGGGGTKTGIGNEYLGVGRDPLKEETYE